MAGRREREMERRELNSCFQDSYRLQGFERGAWVDNGLRISSLQQSVAGRIDDGDHTVMEGFCPSITHELGDHHSVAGAKPVLCHLLRERPEPHPSR